MKDKGLIPFFIPHVGCPHICIFCNQHRIAGVHHIPNPTDIEQSIMKCINDEPHKTWEVAFYGGSFTAINCELQKSLLGVVQQFRSTNCVSDIRCSTRPDAITYSWIEELKSYGLTTIELGVQSMNKNILQASKRGHTVEDVYQAAEVLKSLDMKIGLQLMVGLPGETWNTVVETTVAISKLKPDFVRIYPVLVIKDTELAEQYNSGRYIPLTLEQAVSYSAFIKEYFDCRGIKVIRTGLQATEELSKGDSILAGPYAPAIGEMVYNRQVLQKLEKVLPDLFDMLKSSYEPKPNVEISYSRSDTSKVRGLCNVNKNKLDSEYDKQIMWRENAEIYSNRIIVTGKKKKVIITMC